MRTHVGKSTYAKKYKPTLPSNLSKKILVKTTCANDASSPTVHFFFFASSLSASGAGLGQGWAELGRARTLLADSANSNFGRCPISVVAMRFGFRQDPLVRALVFQARAVQNFILGVSYAARTGMQLCLSPLVCDRTVT